MFRNRLIAGILVWLPLIATVWVVDFMLGVFDNLWSFVPKRFHPESMLGYEIPGLSVLIAFVIIYITGHVVSNYFGKRLIVIWEKLLGKIPGIRSLYGAIKQMTEAILVGSSNSFQKVYLIEYPRKNLWTLGFETSPNQGQIHQIIKVKEQVSEAEPMVNLFIPTTPNPTSGYYIMAAKEQLLEIDVSVEDALKMIVSGGVFVPDSGVAKINGVEFSASNAAMKVIQPQE